MEKSSSSFRKTVEERIDNKKIIEFRKQYGEFLEQGRTDLAEGLAKTNPELSDRAFEFWSEIHKKFIAGKKPENPKQNAIQNSLGKEIMERGHVIEDR